MPKDKDGNDYVIPDYLCCLFSPTGHNSPFPDMYRALVPSGQCWYNLTPTAQDEWREIISKRLKENPEDYLAKMQMMFPKDPKGV